MQREGKSFSLHFFFLHNAIDFEYERSKKKENVKIIQKQIKNNVTNDNKQEVDN